MFVKVLSWALLVQLTYAASWNYTDQGGLWGADYPNCNGKSQSPINVVTESVKYDNELPNVNRNIFFNPPGALNVKNNGHTITVALEDGYTISDAKLLPFPAKAAQYHFHWGTATNDSYTKGSEHTVDGKRYFGELHIVHYNTKYDNISEAVAQSDGLAVFGWFISVTYPQKNLDIGNLLDLAKLLSPNKGGMGAIADRFSVESLIPPDISEYYRYKGSLTTPTCDESVVWTLFKKPIEITQAQAYDLANSFYEETNTTETKIVNNYRAVQDLNGRKVTKPRPLVQENSASSVAVSQSLFLVMTILFSKLF